MGNRGSFPGGAEWPGLQADPHLYSVLRSRMVELYLHSSIPLHGIMLYSLNTGTSLPILYTVCVRVSIDAIQMVIGAPQVFSFCCLHLFPMPVSFNSGRFISSEFPNCPHDSATENLNSNHTTLTDYSLHRLCIDSTKNTARNSSFIVLNMTVAAII
jgi:hypothetical protein